MSLDWTRYFALFWSEKYHSIYNRIRDLISIKSGVTYIIDRNCANQSRFIWFFTSRKNSDVMILITSVFNKDKNNYYCNIFLEKASYELHKKYFFV